MRAQGPQRVSIFKQQNARGYHRIHLSSAKFYVDLVSKRIPKAVALFTRHLPVEERDRDFGQLRIGPIASITRSPLTTSWLRKAITILRARPNPRTG